MSFFAKANVSRIVTDHLGTLRTPDERTSTADCLLMFAAPVALGAAVSYLPAPPQAFFGTASVVCAMLAVAMVNVLTITVRHTAVPYGFRRDLTFNTCHGMLCFLVLAFAALAVGVAPTPVTTAVLCAGLAHAFLTALMVLRGLHAFLGEAVREVSADA